MQDNHVLEEMTRLNNELVAAQRELAGKNAQLEATNRELAVEIVQRQQTEESLRQLSGRLLQLQDDERRRIARELHDSTAQRLAAMIISLSTLEDALVAYPAPLQKLAADCRTAAEDCAQETRTLAHLLHPPLLDELGLEVALDTYVTGLARRSRLRITLEVDPGLEKLSREASLALFRVVQESLSNVLRHSGSPSAAVQLARLGNRLVLEVTDQGRGIAPEVLAQLRRGPSGLGIGIMGMRERLEQLGGTLEIDSSNRGATVRAILPLEPS